jgi:hypothetical protein
MAKDRQEKNHSPRKEIMIEKEISNMKREIIIGIDMIDLNLENDTIAQTGIIILEKKVATGNKLFLWVIKQKT